MLKILLVDDSEDSRLLVSAFLKKAPCSIDTAENGQAALDRLDKDAYGLVLMDIQMPVMDGLEATRAIRVRETAEGAGHRVPVIAMTAYERDEERDKMTDAGCDGYLRKPIRREELLALIERFK